MLVIHRMWSSAASFNFQALLFSFISSSSCFHHFPRLPFSAILPSIFPSEMCFRRQFQCEMCLIQLAFHLFIVCRMFLSSVTFVTLLHFSHDWSNWYSLLYPSTIFQDFLGISDLLSKVYIVLTPSLITPWSRFLLEKLPGLQLVKKFPAFYGTRMFITTFTSACPYPEPAQVIPRYQSRSEASFHVS